jgi:hypothetical protein
VGGYQHLGGPCCPHPQGEVNGQWHCQHCRQSSQPVHMIMVSSLVWPHE